MAFDLTEWKRRLNELLKEHPDIGNRATGMFEANLNEGGVTLTYLNKKVKTAAEYDQFKDRSEKISARIILG